MARPLAQSLRPRKLSELIGQDSLVKAIRKQYKSTREPSAWMFTGGTGQGKTTVARILALSLQCTHGEFGEPCDSCYANSNQFSIQEPNASETTGVDAIGGIARSSLYVPTPPSRRNIYILDEAQGLSKHSQKLLLKYLEDAPESTVWMLCTTEPNSILPTVRRRCQQYELAKLQADDIKKLAMMACGIVKQPLVLGKVVNKLLESGVQSPGLILNVLEKHFAGASISKAIQSVVGAADVLAICRALEKGDWDEIKKQTAPAEGDELRGIRAQVAGYLRRSLEQSVPGPRALEFAQAITRLAQVDSFTTATEGPATVAVLYELCRVFQGTAESDDEDFKPPED